MAFAVFEIPDQPETMRLDTKPGERVRFLGINGYEAQREAAMKVLTVGTEYEVLGVDVGGWESSVVLPEGRFNTVMFANVAGSVPGPGTSEAT